MKFLNFGRVLCLSPHPDDVEYSMLGSMIRANAGTDFDVLCLTKGGAKGFDETNIKFDRRQEIKNLYNMYSEHYDNVNFSFSDFDYFEDLNEPGWINWIETNYSIPKYDAIFIPPQEDSMFEHRFVNNFGSALIRNSNTSLIEYKTPSALNTWIPNIFVNIQYQLDSKLKLLMNFESQLKKK